MMIGTSDAAAQLAATVAPVAVGQHQVQQHEVGLARATRARLGQRRATTGSNPSRVSALENGPEIEASSSTNSTRGFTPQG
jgi:hypothetical protein